MSFKIPWSIRSVLLNEQEIKTINAFLRSTEALTQGAYKNSFENKLKKYLDVEKGDIFAVNSGTSALELTAELLDIKEGDEVILPSHTFCATAIPFLRRGAKLVWGDINPETLVLDYEDVKKKITNKTKAIILVHLYGIPCDIDKFREFDIPLVEDAAQSFGAKYNNKKAGVLCDFGVFSFHAQKNLTTLGQGGALYVRDEELAKKVSPLRMFGNKPFENQDKYWEPAMTNVTDVSNDLPYKYNMSEIQALVGTLLLDRIDELNSNRESMFWSFKEALSNYPEIVFQKIPFNTTSSYHLMPVRCLKDRDVMISRLIETYGIQMNVQYYPLNRYELFQKRGYGEANCSNTDLFFDNMMSFPFHEWMSAKDFDYMINATKETLDYTRTHQT